ncbi:two-component sensor histidine kinase [Actinoplanes cyaneus]|uniref:histidine kinase n=1 Tax=Actinoplanes cyaneus TaxID=52696 RepID=A0A919MA96_9ACTN|nr:histidine kinase [Actinoplanes cyaneus]MCW2142012.1 Signal transduction histidine kinase [Actinoplanes cyaneus]GID63831.1 two-component sensor histidine kinase [Actinoplanes cyaneus]
MPVKMGARGRVAADAAVALAAGAFTIAMLRAGGLGTPATTGYRELDAAGFALTAASVAPLLLARRLPGVMWAVTSVVSLVMLGLGYALDVPPGPLAATYLLAEAVGGGHTPRRRLLAAAGVAGYVPVAIAVMALDGQSVLGMSPGLFAWVAMFGLVWIAGDRTRLRRERIVELEDHARLREQEIQVQRRLVAAEERTRIARELHDSAGHAINVILVQAGAARLLHRQDPDRSVQAITTIEEVASATITDIDRLVRALRQEAAGPTGPAPADPAPADTAALEQLVDRHRAGGLRVTATFDGAPRGLPSAVAWAAYRILQEGLTNAARHGAGTADVRMSYGPAAVEIVVSNPVGERQRRRRGMGIVGMRERAALLDGLLDAGPVDGGVFRLRARLPYQASMGISA